MLGVVKALLRERGPIPVESVKHRFKREWPRVGIKDPIADRHQEELDAEPLIVEAVQRKGRVARV